MEEEAATQNTVASATEDAPGSVSESATENVIPVALSPAVQAFQSFYLAELEGRIQRSEAVGAISLKKGSAALFFDPQDAKFTLVEKLPEVEEAHVFDCVPREQWGRTVMLFGHATQTGGYIASGHATLNGRVLTIKLASGSYYWLDVDSELPHLQPFFQEEKEQKPRGKNAAAGPGNKSQAEREPKRPRERNAHAANDAPPRAAEQANHDAQPIRHEEESEDFTEADFRRLRGEMPLATKAKKKWRD